MDKNLYDMIYKRKSFHRFDDIGNEKITKEELDDIYRAFDTFKPLVDGIKVKIKIVKDEPTCNRGEEYCIFMYSETKDNYLQNIGYLGEQLDLYLVSKNIGSLWFGIGKPEAKKLDNLDYVIMIAIAKINDSSKFRKDMFRSKRKEVNEMWEGNYHLDIANIARFAPSACNSQPWNVVSSDNKLDVYRYSQEGKRGIMPKDKVAFYNQMDIGIFMCFLDLCLEHNNISYTKTIYKEENSELETNLNAIYNL